MENTGTKGDLKEQAQRHCHAHSTATTPLVPPQPPWRDRAAFPAWSSGALPSRTAHPSTSPSLTPAPQRAPWGAGHTPQSPSFLPGARKAPGTTCSWGCGCCSIACPEQDQHPNLGLFRVKGLSLSLPDSPNWSKPPILAKPTRPKCTETAHLGLLSSAVPQQCLGSAHISYSDCFPTECLISQTKPSCPCRWPQSWPQCFALSLWPAGVWFWVQAGFLQQGQGCAPSSSSHTMSQLLHYCLAIPGTNVDLE